MHIIVDVLRREKTVLLYDFRPFPEEYLRYAREDTHYLLYIYDLLRNNLLQKSPQFLNTVYERSKMICQKVC